MQCSFEKTSTGLCHSVILRLWEYQEAQLVLNFFYVAHHFSPKKQDSVLSFRSQPEIFYRWKSYTWDNWWFCFLGHNPHSPKILKNAIKSDICRYSNWTFSATSSLSSSIKISNETFYSCKGRLGWKTIDNNPCIKNVIVQSLKKVVFKKDLSRLSKYCFSLTTILIAFMRFTIINFTLREKELVQFSVTCSFLHQNSDTPKGRLFINFVDLYRNPYSPRMPRILSILKVSSLKLMYFHNYGVDSFHRRQNQKNLNSRRKNGLKPYQP